jgi:hypothetical protein
VAQQVTNGALLLCSFGTAPSQLKIMPEKRVSAGGQPAGTIMDHLPLKNVAPFGLCTTSTNPQVSAARNTPQPCMPVTTAPWAPGSPTVMIGGQPALQNACRLLCQWGGVITVQQPGQVTVTTA